MKDSTLFLVIALLSAVASGLAMYKGTDDSTLYLILLWVSLGFSKVLRYFEGLAEVIHNRRIT